MLKRTLFAAVLAAFPAAAEASDVIQPSAVSRSATIAGGATRTLELSCRAPAIALNATASGLPAGAELRRSSPSAGVLGWSLELAAADSAARQRLGGSIRCLRLELPDGVRDVSLGAATRRTPAVPVPAGETRRTSVRCERGFIPTGYGVDRGGAQVRLAQALAGARGWSFRLANPGSAAAQASVVIRCTRANVEGVRSACASRRAARASPTPWRPGVRCVTRVAPASSASRQGSACPPGPSCSRRSRRARAAACGASAAAAAASRRS